MLRIVEYISYAWSTKRFKPVACRWFSVKLQVHV